MIYALSMGDLLILSSAMVFAYIVFGISGFGSALLISPVLAFFIPIDKIVPLLALLDCSAALSTLLKDRRHAAITELKALIPLMVLGSLTGAAILLLTRPDILLLMLGIFVTGYALYSLSGLKPLGRFSPKAVVPFGYIGGIFSALFGSGGFIYMIYLSGRLEDKQAIRSTQTSIIAFSTFTRLIIFLLAGVYGDKELLLLALICFPAMLIGTFTGRAITLSLPRENFLKLINCIILLAGVTLIVRYVAL